MGALIAEGARLTDVIVQDSGEGVANVPWICSRANGVHDQLYCLAVTFSDQPDQIVQERSEMIQLILGSFGRGLASPVGGFVENTITGMGCTFGAVWRAGALVAKRVMSEQMSEA